VWDDLVRVSCGIEDEADLVADVVQALEKAVKGGKIENGH
jgi:cystathionine gamma-lyase